MELELKIADPLTYDGDALILPITCEGAFEGELAARVKVIVGEKTEQEVAAHAPIAIGAAMATDAPNLPCAKLIHAPVIEAQGMRMTVENVRRAAKAALLAATKYELAQIAMPGFGYGELGVPQDEVARAIVDEVRGYKKLAKPLPTLVVFMDTDEEMVECLKQYI